MTTPDATAPNTSTAATVVRPFGLLYRVILRHTVTRPRLLGLGSLAALLILIGWAAGRSDLETRRAVLLMGNLGLAVLLPIGALILASAALSDLRDDKTLVYLWLRPMDRLPVVVGAYLAALTISLPLTVVPLGAAAAAAEECLAA